MLRVAGWLLLLSCAAALKLVHTPFGPADDDCIVSLPHSSRLRPGSANTLLVDHSSTLSTALQIPDKCARFIPSRYFSVSSQGGPPQPSSPQTNASCPVSSSHDNGWVLNAYYEQPSLGSFAADYVVPEVPSDPHALLYYFIGMTNYPKFFANQSLGVKNIIQPVLSWGRRDGGNSNGSWSLSQWFCCPRGVVAHSSYAWNFQPGDVIHTAMTLHPENNTMQLDGWWDNSSIQVRSDDPNVNGSSSLSLSVDREYNNSEISWINLDVTLEVCGIRCHDDCA